MRWRVNIEENICQEFVIEAESEEAAHKKTEELYKAGELVVEAGILMDCSVYVMGEVEK